MPTHLYETGLRQAAAGLAALQRPSESRIAELSKHLRSIRLEAAQHERADLVKAADEAEAATQNLLVGTGSDHVACVRAVHRLAHLLLLGLRAEAEQPSPQASPEEVRERKILVADDSRVSAVALSNAFLAHDFLVRSVSTMEEAIAELNSFQPCVLVSDVFMPNLDVTLLCRTFRDLADGRRKLVVLVSGSTGDALQSHLDEIKPDAFVAKMAGTASVVNSVLDLWRKCEAEHRR